jgi:formylglycine-generating enzyme required for sulfatase activity
MLSALKLALVLGAAAGTALGLTLPSLLVERPDAGEVRLDDLRPGEPELSMLRPAAFRYRLAGEFTRAGAAANAPVVSVRMARPLVIMRRQVTAAEYQECVREGPCQHSAQGHAFEQERPVVKVSWRDASAYAAWLSRKTGRTYRLPTDEEWVFAAGDRFTDDAVADGDRRDPAKRWLDQYEMESARDSPDKDVRPVGWFGVNAHGLADMGGNVWEWTETCYRRAMLDGTGAETGAVSVNCGVRVVAGRHRSYMTDFVRDARSGGCAVGVPPANLGFRLVRG